jgi:rhamnulokinase
MKASPAFLAIDLGAESGRVVLGRLQNDRFDLKEVYRFANGPIKLGSSIHWDVLNIWQEIKRGMALAARESGNSLISLGVDTWGVDFGLLDNADNLIGNPYHYRDRRTEGMVDAVSKVVSTDEIYRQTGIQIMPINTLYQLASMAASESSALAVARSLLTMPDLFNFWFTGEKVTEYTIATTTQCFNPADHTWAWDIIKKLEIPSYIFNDVVSPGTCLGTIQKSVAEEIGFGKIEVVAVASHDTQSAIVGIPAKKQDYIYISSGTWSLIGIEVDIPVITELSQSYELTNEGGYNDKFCLQKNIMGLWLLQECRREWSMQGQVYTYDDLTEMAKPAAPFQSFINPVDPRFINTGDMIGRIQEFCRKSKQPVPQNEADIVRCIFESLALEYRQVVEQISSMTGRSLDVIHIIGGGARNSLLNQFTANATGRKVIAGPIEATAMGNILVQAISTGHIDSLEEGRDVIRRSVETHEYSPIDTASWENASIKYLKIRYG